MNSKKRVIGVILAVVIVISCIPVMSVTVSATEYSQSNAGDLFTALSNGSVTNIALTSDIDMSAQGVLTSQSAGSVTITGNGHIIKNLKTTRGLFSEVSSCAVSNLGLYNCSVIDMSSSGEGYGLLFGKVGGGTISGCAVAGEIAVYGSASGIGGLVGVNNGASISNSFSMVDIYTDGSYVGGLVGMINSGSVGTVYSTGKIENEGSNYIGGLVGKSAVGVSNAYTTVFIKNAYADTVKAIGCFETDLPDTVFYDSRISLQRQGDGDENNRLNGSRTITGFFSETTALYPGLNNLKLNNSDIFSDLALISRARVDLELPRTSDLLTGSTGREYMKPSTASAYSYATLSHGAGITFDWEISGGIDEYYFNQTNTPAEAYGGTINGLSGNTYDVNTGKYLFVNTGDVAFTAKSGGYERTITVRVTDDNPYITGGNGSSGSHFQINDPTELNNIRLYCLDGAYNYDIGNDITLSGAFTPILGFKGTLNGGGHTITGLAVSAPNGTDAGLLATISGNNSSVSSLHIAGASVAPTSGSPAAFSAANAGILCGSVSASGVTISDVFVSGDAGGSAYSGLIAGSAGSASITSCASMGNSGVSDTAVSAVSGGLVGSSSGTLTNCYSTAVVQGTTAGGLSGNGGTYTTCLFTGMFKDCGTVNPLGSGTNSGSFFDSQSTSVSGGAATVTLTDSLQTGFTSANWTLTGGGYPVPKTVNDNWSAAATLAAMPVTYNYSSNPNSRRFITADSGFTPSADYSVTPNDSTRYSFNSTNGRFSLTQNGGGPELFTVLKSGISDVRTLYFNVRQLKVYIKYVYGGTNYGNSTGTGMSSIGLTSLTTEFGDAYNLSIVHNGTDYKLGNNNPAVTIAAAGDSITVSPLLPKQGYSAQIFAGATSDAADDSVTPCAGGAVPLANDQPDVYVRVVISSETLPWGVYRIFCGRTAPET